MKRSQILHNPGAGKADYTKEELVAILKSHGFDCRYSSTKEKGWKDIDEEIDFIVIAGGDGTVRKVVLKLIDKIAGKYPIALLPMGTANNIAKSLGITGHAKDIISGISAGKSKKFDVGRISGVKESELFLEGFGFGIFPDLMQRMKDDPSEDGTPPEVELKTALERVHKIILSQPAEEFEITVDGTDHSGRYIMVEVMNIISIGPNLGLSPGSDPGDGEFEVVLIAENRREEFATYVKHKIDDLPKSFIPLIVKGKDIRISTSVQTLHVDDELITVKKPAPITIIPEHAMIEFLIH